MMTKQPRSLLATTLLTIGLSQALLASAPTHWAQFRGTDGKAVAPGQSIPLEFGPDKNRPYVASPTVYRDRVYFVKAGGYLSCLDARTGKAHYQSKRLGVAGEYYATPVAAGDYVIICPLRGTVLMIEAADRLNVAARNVLGEQISSTPAVVDNTLYLRGEKHLWAFAN